MMAKMRMANITKSPICISGAKALKMDLSTTWRPKVVKKAEITFSGLDKWIERKRFVVTANSHGEFGKRRRVVEKKRPK